MKKMMFLLIALSPFIVSWAFADVNCTTSPVSQGPTVSLYFDRGGNFEISYFDGSRNTHSAVYKDVSPPIALARKLKKIVDQSIGSEMPEILEMIYDGKPTHSPEVEVVRYKIFGLFPGQTVDLLEKNCMEN